jgi:putative transposase
MLPLGCVATVSRRGDSEVFVRARLQPCRKRMWRSAALAAEGMAVPKRHCSPPGTYFVTSKTWEGHSIFQRSETCKIYVDALLHYRDEGKYLLHGFVLMPDHFHLLLTPSGDVTLERVVQFIKGGSARRMGEVRKRKFPVWQRGFSDHRIRDAADFALHMAYIEQNPVKKGLAATAREYAWSSASGVYRMDEAPQGLKPLN